MSLGEETEQDVVPAGPGGLADAAVNAAWELIAEVSEDEATEVHEIFLRLLVVGASFIPDECDEAISLENRFPVGVGVGVGVGVMMGIAGSTRTRPC